MAKVLLMIFLLCSVTVAQTTDYKIVNFDKLMAGTDKMFFVEPPPGTYWTILQGSTFIEHTIGDGATFNVWLENAPYWSYRDEAGKLRGCLTGCVTLMRKFTDKTNFFPIHGTMPGPIVVSWPNRLGIAVTPAHGGLLEPLQTWTSFAIVERPLRH